MTETRLYPEFTKKLKHLINECSMDAATDTPDYLLAEYLVEQLEAYRKVHKATGRWYAAELQQQPTISIVARRDGR